MMANQIAVGLDGWQDGHSGVLCEIIDLDLSSQKLVITQS